MIDSSALSFISKQAVNAAAPHTLDTHVHAVVLDGSIVSIEHLGEAPVRHRATFTTTSLPSFISYCERAASKRDQPAELFVDQEVMRAEARFDMGSADNPRFSQDIADLKLRKTAEFKALVAVHQSVMSQKAAIDFFLDWAPNVTFFDAEGDHLVPAKAIAALRSITIATKGEFHNEERDTGRTRSAFEAVEAKSKDVLPAEFIFTAAPYLGLCQRDIRARLTINTEGEKPTITPRIIGLEKLQEQLGEELVEALTRHLGSAANVTIGNLLSTN